MDDAVKQQGTAALAAMGLSAADAVRLLFHRIIADQAFPLELKVPNVETRAAIGEADALAAGHAARFANADELFACLEQDAKQ